MCNAGSSAPSSGTYLEASSTMPLGQEHITSLDIQRWMFGITDRDFSGNDVCEFILQWKLNGMGALDLEGLQALYDAGALDILVRAGSLDSFENPAQLWKHVFHIGSASALKAGSADGNSSWDGGSLSCQEDEEEEENDGENHSGACEELEDNEDLARFKRDNG